MHVAAVDLPAPAIADFDLTVPGRGSVANNEVIGQSVLHPPHVAMVIIESGGVALSRAAVVHNNELPASRHDRGTIDLGPD